MKGIHHKTYTTVFLVYRIKRDSELHFRMLPLDICNLAFIHNTYDPGSSTLPGVDLPLIGVPPAVISSLGDAVTLMLSFFTLFLKFRKIYMKFT